MDGDDGYLDTRIVYVAESGPANKRIKRLAIMDQDGHNHQFHHRWRGFGADPAFLAKRPRDCLPKLFQR